MASAAPLSEISIIWRVRSRSRACSPGRTRVVSMSAANGVIVTARSDLPLSTERMHVIIFVMLAGYSRLSAFFSYSTSPVLASMRIAASAVIERTEAGGAASAAGGTGGAGEAAGEAPGTAASDVADAAFGAFFRDDFPKAIVRRADPPCCGSVCTSVCPTSCARSPTATGACAASAGTPPVSAYESASAAAVPRKACRPKRRTPLGLKSQKEKKSLHPSKRTAPLRKRR